MLSGEDYMNPIPASPYTRKPLKLSTETSAPYDQQQTSAKICA